MQQSLSTGTLTGYL